MSATGLAPVTVLALTGDLAALRLHDTRRGIVAWPQAGRVRRVLLCSEAGDVLDEALAVGTHAGGELHLHGGTSVRDGVMDWLGRSGCMLESLEHGTAPTSWRHVRAKLSARCGPMARLCAEVTAALEAECIDPDLRARIAAALDWAPFAQALRRPPVVRLVGRPNAGKSTLFNALLGSERALASPEPGTTRDLVGASWQLLGVPVCLEDTAGGLPETTDADLVVEVLDGATAVSTCRNALRVHGRADLHARLPHATRVSSRTGEGLERLRGRIAGRLGLPADLQRDLLAPVETAHLALLTAAGDFASQQPKGCRAPTGHRPAARR